MIKEVNYSTNQGLEILIGIRCRFCNKLMKSNKCKCGASYQVSKEFGNFLVWRKEIK